MRMIRYTLRAAKRGNFVRGQSFTCPEDGERDRELRGSKAWVRAVIPGASAATTADAKAQSAFVRLRSWVQEQASVVATLSPEQREAYGEMVHGAVEAMLDQIRLVFPVTDPAIEELRKAATREIDRMAELVRDLEAERDTTDAEIEELRAKLEEAAASMVATTAELDAADADDLEITPEPRGGQADVDDDGLVALLESVINGSDTDATIANMVEAAAVAGIDVPDTLPRTRVGVADVLHELATVNPSDLGD